MRYEVHLTVSDVPSPGDRHGLKYTAIELDRGDHPVQPMFSGRGSGDPFAAARTWAALLDQDQLALVRVKIELDASPPDFTPPPGLYYEHHVKLLLTTTEGLAARVAPHHAHLSRNARRHRADGRHERFVTQRVHDPDVRAARARLEALLAGLAGYDILEVEREWVIADDNLALDNGWLDAPVSPA